MKLRVALQLAILATSAALGMLAAADRVGDHAAGVEMALTRPDKSGHPLPEGKGWELEKGAGATEKSGERSGRLEAAMTDRFQGGGLKAAAAPGGSDEWRAGFLERLDRSITELRVETRREPTPAFAATVSAPEFSPTMPKRKTQDHFPALAGILHENGLPPGLMGVVAVESGFNPLALSPKGARGLWQLMPATARRYGLVVGPQLDERTDPVKSTHAAAAYMKDLFAQFRDWPLALAAYNAGEERVERAIGRTGTRDFSTLRQRAALPDETLRYVPAVLAKLQSLPNQASEITGSSAERTSPSFIMEAPRIRGQVLYAEIARPPASPYAD